MAPSLLTSHTSVRSLKRRARQSKLAQVHVNWGIQPGLTAPHMRTMTRSSRRQARTGASSRRERPGKEKELP